MSGTNELFAHLISPTSCNFISVGKIYTGTSSGSTQIQSGKNKYLAQIPLRTVDSINAIDETGST